jgi:glycogen operon protein
VRRFWRGDAAHVGALAQRVAGSADLFGGADRDPFASVNFVTAHDGFTMLDLVSYGRKHNTANGEGNRDGTDANWSSNQGIEGATPNEEINRKRLQLVKSMLATLAFSQGVPMLSHGDEIGRTQAGNNNAYCQDNEISWVDWNLETWQLELLEFTRRAFRVRTEHPILRRRSFFSGTRGAGERIKDVTWLTPSGREMTGVEWADRDRRVLGMLVAGEGTDAVDERGRPIAGPPVYIAFNAGSGPALFDLPTQAAPGAWQVLISTSDATEAQPGAGPLRLPAQNLCLLAWLSS